MRFLFLEDELLDELVILGLQLGEGGRLSAQPVQLTLLLN